MKEAIELIKFVAGAISAIAWAVVLVGCLGVFGMSEGSQDDLTKGTAKVICAVAQHFAARN